MGVVDGPGREEDGDHRHLAKMGKDAAPRTTDSSFLQWKWSSSCLVYGLLAITYLLIIILLGLLISSGSRFSSEVRKLHKEMETSKELFPCGSRSREWEFFDGGCYYFSVQKVTWHMAQSQCAKRNSSLVVIHDEAKQNFIESQTRNERYWIGLNDVDEEGEWRWIDGTNYLSGYKNWRPGQPSDYQNKEDCAEVHFSGEWNDESCTTANLYICEKPLPS